MIEAVLWDNDGVLVDTEELFFRATRAALARAGVSLTLEHYADFIMRRGQSVFEMVAARGWSVEQVAALRRERDAAYAESLRAESRSPMAGILETLRTLQGRFRMAVVTSSARAHLDIAHQSAGLAPFFEVVVAAEDYTHSKPDPEPYLTALRKMALAPQQCVAVEDSERGLAAARAAGVRCIVVPNQITRGCVFSGATAVLADATELLSALANLQT